MLSKWVFRAALMASAAAGLTIQPTNITQESADVDLALPSGNTIAVYSTLEPLTAGADDLPVITRLLEVYRENVSADTRHRHMAFLTTCSMPPPKTKTT